jgi:CheY-like chemotaxis protein
MAIKNKGLRLVAALPEPQLPRELLTILLVEDEAFVRNVTAEVLRSYGYKVLIAANAQEAREIFVKHVQEVQLLLTDMIMPGTNGRKLAMELRELSATVRIIVTSGYPECTVDDETAADLYFLPKPFSVQSLIAKIRQVTAASLARAARV